MNLYPFFHSDFHNCTHLVYLVARTYLNRGNILLCVANLVFIQPPGLQLTDRRQGDDTYELPQEAY